MSDTRGIDLLLTGGTVVTDGQAMPAWIAVRDGIIADVGRAGQRAPAAREVHDVCGRLVVPGFVELHVHGGGGSGFDAAPDDLTHVARALATHRQHGTTTTLVSLVSASRPELLRRITACRDAIADDPGVLGIHLEGPWIADSWCGAQDPAALRPPRRSEITEALEAGAGKIQHVTVAPELPGGLDAVRQLVAAGVTVAVGHTGASYDQALAAFDAGATLLTHAGNRMPAWQAREPGPMGAAHHHRDVVVELIADGVHLHSATLRGWAELFEGRWAGITDSMAAAGAGDGMYWLAGRRVAVRDGVARLVQGGEGSDQPRHNPLAGAVATSDVLLRTAVDAGIALPAAVEALTWTPARVLDVADRVGSLRTGYSADMVVLDGELHVCAVLARGLWLRELPHNVAP